MAKAGVATAAAMIAVAQPASATTITYDLTIDGLHTYYVVAGQSPVLVHNCDGATTGLFENHYPGDTPREASTIDPSTLQKGVSGKFGYVVTEDGGFVVGKVNAQQGHIDLAGGARVQAAGEFKVVNGSLRWIDNASGHYVPGGDLARQAAEIAFSEAGLDAEGTYVERWPGSQAATGCTASNH